MTKEKFFKSELAGYLWVTFLVVYVFRILATLHRRRLIALSDAAYGVVEGMPHWLAHQNRLLGPYAVLLISKAKTIDYVDAWIVFQALALQILSVLVFWIFRREGLSKKESLGYLLCLLLAFLAFQDRWFFVWDTVDLIICAALAYGILRSASIPYFIGLFLVAILNKETALFIAAYLILNSFHFERGRDFPKFKNPVSLVTGMVLLVGGVIYTKWVRHALFIMRADGLPDTEHELLGNHISLLKNVNDLFYENLTGPKFYISILLLGAIAYLVSQWKKMDDGQMKCLLTMLFMFANILVFGIVNETRSHFVLFPFFLFLALSINGEFKNDSQAPAV